MLVHMSQYVDERSAATSPAPVKISAKPVAPKSKKGKINFVSKASLAIFDPRHAMGIDTGDDWYASGSYSPASRSSFDHPSQRALRHSEDNARNQQWSTSPTPELEAFTASMDDHPYGSFSTSASTEMTRQQSASSSVFEDDRDLPETTSRRRFLSRKSTAPARATTPTDDILFSPLGVKTKSNRNAGAGAGAAPSSNASSSFTRFFARKKKDKASHLVGLASRSTPDLFDGIPQSAPPTTLTFEQSGFQFSPQRKASDASSLHSSPSSLPTSPERRPIRIAQELSPVRASPLSTKQSMPALRQIREAHNAAGGASQARSITFASPERKPRQRPTAAIGRSDSFETAPALPPLPSFNTSSPMLPIEFAWDAKRGNATGRESQTPSSTFTIRPTSRVVSSTGRGVPSPGVSPVRPTDARKSTVTLRNMPALRFAEDVRSAPAKSSVTRPAASPRRHADPKAAAAALEKRKSMTQRVVDGLLDQNHGREEPEMRARRTDMEVRSARRRSRSADGRTLPSLKTQDFVDSPSSNSHSDSVFPAFVRHAPMALGRSKSPQSRFFVDSDAASVVTPTPPQAPSFTSPRAASPSRSPVRAVAQSQSPSRRSPQRQASGETHQARRVNFAGQRAKAVAVASPLLLSKSPRLGGRSGTPLPVVNIMPPTPDLAQSEEDKQRQEAVLQQEREVVAAKEASAAASASHTGSAKAVEAAEVATKPQSASVENALPSRQGAVTPTPKTVGAQASAAPAPVTVMSPESVYSPASVYSPEAGDGLFSSLHGGLFNDDDVMDKEEMQITADSVAAELSYVGMPRTESVTSELSQASSARSSSSGAFAFSRSMSSSSLVSGGTYSSASSNASESPDRKMGYLPSVNSLDFSPTKMTSSASLASTVGTSIFEVETEMRDVSTAKSNAEVDASEALAMGKLKTPFQLKSLTVDTDAAQSAADSSDCETPTLASCRQMGANTAPRTQMQPDKASTNRQLGLSMDLSDLAQELGLGRLSQIGLSHLKGVDAFAEKPAARQPTLTLGTVHQGIVPKISPAKPPKSSARAAPRSAPAPTTDRSDSSLARFGMSANDIAASAAMSPLPVSIAGRSPQTPPRTRAPVIEPKPGRKVSASGVPKIDGGFGLGLNFIESPSPQSQPRKAAIAPGSYGQHVVEHTHIVPPQYYQQQQHYAYEQQEEAEWVGVAM